MPIVLSLYMNLHKASAIAYDVASTSRIYMLMFMFMFTPNIKMLSKRCFGF